MNFLAQALRTRRLIAEHSAGFWTATHIAAALNEMYYRAQNRVSVFRPQDFQVVWTWDLVAGTASYVRPSFEPVRTYRRLPVGGDPGDPNEFLDCTWLTQEQAKGNSEGSVLRWPDYPNFAVFESGDRVRVIPTPTANQNDGFRAVLRSPISMVGDNEVPRLPLELHERLCQGAAAYLMQEERTADEKAIARCQANFDEFFGINADSLKRLQRLYPEAQARIYSLAPQTTSQGYGGRANNRTVP